MNKGITLLNHYEKEFVMDILNGIPGINFEILMNKLFISNEYYEKILFMVLQSLRSDKNLNFDFSIKCEKVFEKMELYKKIEIEELIDSFLSIKYYDYYSFETNFIELFKTVYGQNSIVFVKDFLNDEQVEKLNLSKEEKYVIDDGKYKAYSICHHVYNSSIKSNQIVLAIGNCFRKEKIYNENRLPKFRMIEAVFFGDEHFLKGYEEISLFFMKKLLESITDSCILKVANDTFLSDNFEKVAAHILNRSKIEILCLNNGEKIACGSFNRHNNHFTKQFEIKGEDGLLLRSQCLGFGIERLYNVYREYQK